MYYLRVHTLAGAAKSRASSEIRVFVETATGPTAPANLLGLVNGSNLTLVWRNTFGGGAPTAIVLDVTGSISTSVALGVTETFSFNGVPAGTYTLDVRAVNGVGSSGSSNPVTLTFPTACSGTPQTPIDFVASVSGNTAMLSWMPAATAAAPTRYEINVNVANGFTGRFTTTTRSLASAAPPGTYAVSVRAGNACGNSAFTAPVTIVVP
jgi:hypothetical protein